MREWATVFKWLQNEHIDWVKQKRLQVGDEICVEVVESASTDKAVSRRRNDPAETLKAKKNYVRVMAKELGWKIETNSRRIVTADFECNAAADRSVL